MRFLLSKDYPCLINTERKNKMKKVIALLLCIFTLITFVSCTKNDNGKTNSNESKTKDITVVLDWTPNTNHTGMYIALEKGYYKDAGLNVEITQPPEDGATSLVASGKAQFGIDFQDVIAPAFAQTEPLPVTAVAAVIQHNTSGIVSLKEKNINSPKALENHNYATWESPVEQSVLKDCMEADGGDFSKLTLVPSTVSDIISALQTNIDSVWIFYAWDGIALENANIDTNYFAFKDIKPEFDYYTPILIANNEFLKNDPETAKAFLEATAKGYTDAISDPDGAADILLKYAPELDENLVRKSQKWLASQYISDASAWGVFDKDRWNAFYDYLWEKNLIEKEIPDDFGFTNDYLSK